MYKDGCTKGDEEREYIFTGGKRNTIIDYAIRDEEVRERVEKVKIEKRMESDHLLMEVWIKGERRGNRGGEEGKGSKL